ncbi:4-hydroxybenzoate octaprenyltransferase [Hydrocarboniphaga sp.]|uniref:4-hydroxybenzoate octaprenyltransferase n=1 Tax=Hydrocarboniphaga sp. TaxID=2033016 RepID=UPI003D0A6D04
MNTAPPPGLLQQFAIYLRLMRFHKPIGIYLLLWPTLWGLWLAAGGLPPLKVFVVFVLGTVLMRAAGCVINDYADRDFDGHVARTRDRPIAAGAVQPSEAVRLAVVLALIAFGLTTSLHSVPVLLLSVPAVITAAVYPFMKRYISVPQAVLGLAFSWGIPMAYVAVRGSAPVAEVAALMLANLCWVVAYDTYYAMADREDDLKLGVKSSAIFFGRHDRSVVIALQVAALVLLAGLGASRHLAWPYFAGLAGAAATVIHQAQLTRRREPAKCFAAFLNNNLFGASVFLGLMLSLMM